MDKRFQKALQEVEALNKDPGTLPWKLDEPWAQRFYSWDAEEEAWKPASTANGTHGQRSGSIFALAFYSWNIDLMLPFAESRMEAALAHLEKLLSQLSSPATTAVVINLQECIPSDFATISRQKWVRDGFYMTDLDPSSWASGAYGVTTLVDRRLDVVSCFRVHYSKTQQERDVLFVDVSLPAAGSNNAVLRLGNSHLESFALDPPLRPSQVQIVSTYMRADNVSNAIAMGDFNAIQPFDKSLHSDNGLKDAYLELGGREDSDEGHTWGQQALRELRERFGGSRMDKAYFYGGDLKLLSFERFGTDVEVHQDKKKQRDQLLSLGFEKAWVTDHLGVKAVFSWKSSVRL